MYQVIISINNNEDVIVLPAVPPDIGPQIPQNNGTYEGLSRDYNTLGTMGLWEMTISSLFPVGKQYSFMPSDALEDGWQYVSFFERNRPRMLPFRVIILDSHGVCRLNSPCSVDSFSWSVKRNGDITEAVNSPEARDKFSALSVELTFTAVRNNNRDKYMHWYNIQPGDKLRVVNHGTEVFSGVILTVGLDGTVTANDPGWYLTKSEIVLQLDNAAAADAVRRMCAKAGIPAGTIDLPPTRISEVWVGSTPEQILEDILDICSAETGLVYRRRVRGGTLQVEPLPSVPIIAYHKAADNLDAFDITLAKGDVTGSDSMAELVNSVVLAEGGNTAKTLGRAYNSASIAKYGLLQTVDTLSGDETTAQARQRVKNLLSQGDRLTRERTVEEIWGADEVVSGILLQFQSNSYGVSGVQRVTGVTHRYGHPHLMSLTVEAWPDSRAAGSNDTITV